jgi:hypothetical protein
MPVYVKRFRDRVGRLKRSLSLAVFVRGNGISSVETKAPKPSLKFLRQRQSAHTRKDLTSGVFARLPGTTSGPIARCSEQATNNRLVGSSSPPSPTTQSCANRDFPVQCETTITCYISHIFALIGLNGWKWSGTSDGKTARIFTKGAMISILSEWFEISLQRSGFSRRQSASQLGR